MKKPVTFYGQASYALNRVIIWFTGESLKSMGAYLGFTNWSAKNEINGLGNEQLNVIAKCINLNPNWKSRHPDFQNIKISFKASSATEPPSRSPVDEVPQIKQSDENNLKNLARDLLETATHHSIEPEKFEQNLNDWPFDENTLHHFLLENIRLLQNFNDNNSEILLICIRKIKSFSNRELVEILFLASINPNISKFDLIKFLVELPEIKKFMNMDIVIECINKHEENISSCLATEDPEDELTKEIMENNLQGEKDLIEATYIEDARFLKWVEAQPRMKNVTAWMKKPKASPSSPPPAATTGLWQ
jgi:hypothetical protein